MSDSLVYFDREVLKPSATTPVLVDFWAAWCGPCRMLGPVLEKLAAEPGAPFKLVKVNTEEHPELASRFRIQSIPAVMLFDKGQVIGEFMGALPEAQIRKWLEQHIPNEAARLLTAAKAALANDDLTVARPLLEQVVSLSPKHHLARALLAKTLVFDDAPRALELVAAHEDGHEGNDIALAVRTLAALASPTPPPADAPATVQRAWEPYQRGVEALRRRDFQTAVEAFIESMRTSRKLHDDGARHACIAIFNWLGEAHPVTLENRRAFASALY